MAIEFTDVQFRPVNAGSLLAGGSLMSHGWRINFTIVKGRNGPFVSLPSRPGKEKGKWYSEVSIPDSDDYRDFQERIIALWRKEESSLSDADDGAPF